MTAGSPVDAASVTITDDDTATVSVAAASAAEGGAVTFTVSLSGEASSDVTVDWTTADGTADGGRRDYTAVSDGQRDRSPPEPDQHDDFRSPPPGTSWSRATRPSR